MSALTRYCAACEQDVADPCISVDCATPDRPQPSADDARDAARYRYLRDTETLDTAIWEALDGEPGVNGVFDKASYAAGMDEAIDAAMKGSK